MKDEFSERIKKVSKIIMNKLKNGEFEIKYNNELYIKINHYTIKLGSSQAFEGYNLTYILLFEKGTNAKRLPLEYLPDEIIIYNLYNGIVKKHNINRDLIRETEKKKYILHHLRGISGD